jgi:hypothetical protein
VAYADRSTPTVVRHPRGRGGTPRRSSPDADARDMRAMPRSRIARPVRHGESPGLPARARVAVAVGPDEPGKEILDGATRRPVAARPA